MKRLSKLDFSDTRPEIVRSKRIFGLMYGVVAGITFAGISWGWDGYLLSTSHGYLPWNMLITGSILCMIVGGIAGWLTARMESILLGILFWLGAALLFAWLVVSLPLVITPYIISKIDPQLGRLLDYERDIEFIYRFGVALAWVCPFTIINGLLQLPTVEPAVFATSWFGKMLPYVLCIIIMLISGSATDNLINIHFRTAVLALDETIQFVADNRNNDNIDPVLSRKFRATSMRNVREYVSESRYLFVSSYDEFFGEVYILVKFEDQIINCNVLYGLPVNCKLPAE